MSHLEEIDVNFKASSRGAFGELITTHKTPIVQIENKYHIDPDNLSNMEIFEATGGSADNDANMFRCQTGTSIGGYGVVRSKDSVNYRAGQGVEAMFTASFTTGIATSLQFAGMFSLTETFAFGYDGADFSAIHEYNGQAEIQLITVTVTGAGTCTVTLDNTASAGITVTNNTVQENAREIADGLKADTLANSWRFEQVDDKVFCISKSVGDKSGTMSISGGVTANIVEDLQGVAKSDSNVAQAGWDNTPFTGFDPTFLNLYKVQYGYLGTGNLNFFIYNPSTGQFELVHTIQWANTNTTPNFGNPNLKIGWTSASLGSSGTNLTVKGASAGMFLEGDEAIRNSAYADVNTVASVGATLTNLITIKNRIVYGDHFNLGKSFPLIVSVDNEHNKGIIVEVFLNPDVAGVVNYQYEDEWNSIMVSDKAGTTVTNGTLIDAFVVSANSSEVVE